MKQYIISEEELKELYDNQDWAVIPDNSQDDFKDFLKSKTPVEVAAEGKIIRIFVDAKEGDLKVLHKKEINDFEFNLKGELILKTNKKVRILIEEIE